jgi:hypothetical protein
MLEADALVHVARGSNRTEVVGEASELGRSRLWMPAQHEHVMARQRIAQ